MKLMSILTLILLLVQLGSGFCLSAENPIPPSLFKYHMIQGFAVFGVAIITMIWALVKVSRVQRSRAA